MADVKYSAYSSKGIDVAGNGLKYGVNEMAETALSMGMNSQRKVIVEGITSNIENQFLNEIVQDGLSAGLGYFSGQFMQIQEKVLEGAFDRGAGLVVAWYGKSKLGDAFKGFKKGRKSAMLAKFLGATNDETEKARLIADFVKMDADMTANSHNPLAQQQAIEGKYHHETLEVQKEGVRSELAKLQTDGMRDTFDMKLKTSSFFNTDKRLIQQMTGMPTVSEKEIKKLNALSSSMVSLDSEGNWIGGNEASINLLNALGLHRAS